MASQKAKRPDVLALGALLALSAAVASVSGVATVHSVGSWYPALVKPSFNPPNWLFGPVWLVLYAAMAVAAWRVWRQRDRLKVRRALSLYGGQMALNFAWSLIFFGLRQITAAVADILALLVVLAITLAAFWKVDRFAGLLMVPYLVWIMFAALLTFAIWRLN